MSDSDLKIKIKFEGGDADQHRLELYDAGVAIHGLARSMAITIHALLNDGAIRSRVKKINGAKLYIEPSRKGSWEEIVQVVIETGIATQIGPSVLSSAVWDFIKWSWAKATNLTCEEPKSRFAQKVLRNNPELETDLSMALEHPLSQFHRPIEANETMTIKITKSRTKEELIFTRETLDYVTTTEDPELETKIKGNVTRYNILTGNGRFYVDKFKKTVSFSLDSDVSSTEKQYLTQSMHRVNSGHPGKIFVDADNVTNKANETKRLVIKTVNKLPGHEW
jgi:hypothetical protein